jgi:hypothetical protein
VHPIAGAQSTTNRLIGPPRRTSPGDSSGGLASIIFGLHGRPTAPENGPFLVARTGTRNRDFRGKEKGPDFDRRSGWVNAQFQDRIRPSRKMASHRFRSPYLRTICRGTDHIYRISQWQKTFPDVLSLLSHYTPCTRKCGVCFFMPENNSQTPAAENWILSLHPDDTVTSLGLSSS